MPQEPRQQEQSQLQGHKVPISQLQGKAKRTKRLERQQEDRLQGQRQLEALLARTRVKSPKG